MDLQVAVLCDAATDSHGKLNILGTFDTIFTGQLPAVHPQCSIALRMSFNKVEEGKHHVKLMFVDEDGRPVMRPVEMSLEVAMPEDTIFLARNFVINIQQLKFEKFGLYSIHIAMDGRQEGSISLQVKKHEPRPEKSHRPE